MIKKCKICNIDTKNPQYCSVICRNKGISKSHKKYPIQIGVCKQCCGPIIANNAGFAKKNRQFCSKSCKASVENKKRIFSLETRKKLAEAAKKRGGHRMTEAERKAQSIRFKGVKSHFWQGGITAQNTLLRNGIEVKIWREKIFKRDNYTCQLCGDKNGNGHTVTSNADHIKPWALYPGLRFELSNGRTLCLKCHLKTDTFGFKTKATCKSLTTMI